MSEIYRIISMVAFSISAVCLILSVIFWIKFNIPKILGDLSGRNARKSIEEIREKNSKQVFEYSNRAVDYNKMSDVGKSKKTGKIGRTTTGSISKTKKGGAITGKIGKAKNTFEENPIYGKQDEGINDVSYGTDNLNTDVTFDQFGENCANISNAVDDTDILNATDVVCTETVSLDTSKDTDVLTEDAINGENNTITGTCLLSDEMKPVIICSVTIVHTDETI